MPTTNNKKPEYQARSSYPVILFNNQGYIIDINHKAARLCEKPKDTLIGSHYYTLFASLTAEPTDNYELMFKKEMQSFSSKVLIRQKNNAAREMEAIFSVIHGQAEGELIILTLQEESVAQTDVNTLKETQNGLEYKVDSQAIITLICTQFINLKGSEIDVAINSALSLIGLYHDEERGFLFQVCDNGEKACNIYEWCDEGIQSMKQYRREIRLSDFPFVNKSLQNYDIVHIPDVDLIPAGFEKEKKVYQSIGIKSLLVVPIVLDDFLIGFFGFESSTMKKMLQEESISLMRITALVFANVLDRKRIKMEIVKEIMKRLSVREQKLLQFLVKGYKWPADKRLIGREMDVLPGTLDKFMTRIKQKTRGDELDSLINTLIISKYYDKEE